MFTITLGDYLKSLYVDENDESHGYRVNDGMYGTFTHYNDIISQTFNTPFEDMVLDVDVPDEFKKDFCRRFYHRSIGFDVFSKFQMRLETVLNTECFNYFKFYKELRKLDYDIDDLANVNIDNTSKIKGNGNTNASQLDILSTTPKNDLNIIYNDETNKVIKYADQLQEHHNKNSSTQDQETTGNTKGINGARSRIELLNLLARLKDLQLLAYEAIDKACFMQVY